MVGFVIVSHSQTLADGVVELTKMMADGVPIRAAGGLEDGGFGTSYEKIANAIEEIYSDDGVIVLMDMGVRRHDGGNGARGHAGAEAYSGRLPAGRGRSRCNRQRHRRQQPRGDHGRTSRCAGTKKLS